MGAPPARLREIAVRLRGFGHEVTVVTAFPNRPQGRIFPGYEGHFLKVTQEEGIRVIRTWIRPSADSASFIGRTINDLSFTWSSAWSGAQRLGPLDVLIVQNPPLFSAFSARRLALRTGAKTVMWCGDVWPDVLLESGQLRPGRLATVMRWLQQYGFRRSALLAVTNPRIAAAVQRSYRCPRTVVWSNGVDTREFSPQRRDPALRASLGVGDGQVLVGYVGLHGRFQGLEAIVDAAIALREDRRFHFVFVGTGVEKARLVSRAAGCETITFLDPQPKSAMPALVASCDISVVSLSVRMPGTMPSKFYEACACGSLPLTADGCEAAPLVREHDCGVVYEPGDAVSARAALCSLANLAPEARERMATAARRLAQRFDRDRLAGYVQACLLALRRGEPVPETDW